MFFLVAALLPCQPIETAPPPRSLPLTAARLVRRLTPGQAAEHRPVRITGVVTYADPQSGDLFVQDETAGLCVRPPRSAAGPTFGDRVVVEGTTDPGVAGAVVRATDVRVTGQGGLPDPHPYDLDPDDARWLDGLYVQAWVVVEAVTAGPTATRLAVHTARGSGTVVIPGDRVSTLRSLVGSALRVRGVLAAGFAEDRTIGRPPTIFTQVIPALPLTPTAPTPVPQLIDLRLRFIPDPSPAARRVVVAGVVTANPRPDLLFIQDDTAGAAVHPSGPVTLRPGTRVEVTGWLDLRGPRLHLTRADVRAVTPGEGPTPTPADPADVRGGQSDGRLIELVGRLEGLRPKGSDAATALIVRNGTTWFEAVLPGRPPDGLAVGSTVGLTGVPATGSVDGERFVVHLRSAADLTVVEPPPAEAWWPPRRVAAVAVGLALVGAVALAWVGTLRVRVRRQTAQLRRQFEAEAALEARYRDLFENAGDAVWVTDPSGAIVSLNRSAAKLFGVAREEAVGQPITRFLPAAEADRLRASGVSRAGGTFELTVVPPAGPPATVEVSAEVLPDGGVQTIARDVTERARLQDRIRRIEKLEAVGRLAGGIAHDFNNLLTVINGASELLADRLPDGDPSRQLVADIRDAGSRAADLTRQLLAFSRRRFVAPGPLDLNAVVSSTANLLCRLLGGAVELVTVLDPDLPTVTGESSLVEQILLNLAVNARDAMPDGGTLTVRTERSPAGAARLTVSDTGVGMPPDVQARVFEPFFTTKPVGQGTGLGLATVYGAVQTLGGAIRFSSAVGRGTTFEIDLPAADGSPTPEPTAPPAPESVVRPATVLVVDDEEAVRSVVRDVLTRQGMTVLTAADGPAALALAADYRGEIDVLLADVRMPQMGGWDVAARLTAARPGTRVVLTSGFDGADTPPPSARVEWAFLPKPFTPGELTDRVRDAVRPAGGSKLHTALGDGPFG